MRVLSGIQPSGALHIGNYFGAIRQHLALQKDHEAFYFIADYHAMTTVQDKERLAKYTWDVALDYLALGLDPNQAVFFRQSDVPEVLELAWVLAVVSGKGLLDRAHSYKDKVQHGIAPSIGLYYYPVLMAADILLYQPDVIPVGQDQKQHVEITQDMAQSFNHTYQTTLLKRPEPVFTNTPKVLGIDGEKMSKSYNNTIGLFEDPKVSYKKIMSIKTDSLPVESPKNPDTCLVMGLLRLFASPEETLEWETKYRAGGMGYGQVKKRLFELYESTFGPKRAQREFLEKRPDEVNGILQQGAKKARVVARETLQHVRRLVGLPSQS